MRGWLRCGLARAFRLPIIAAMTALGLSGCMHTSGPVATAQPQSDLDYMAYGQPYDAHRRARSGGGGGAIARCAPAFRVRSRGPRYAPRPVPRRAGRR